MNKFEFNFDEVFKKLNQQSPQRIKESFDKLESDKANFNAMVALSIEESKKVSKQLLEEYHNSLISYLEESFQKK